MAANTTAKKTVKAPAGKAAKPAAPAKTKPAPAKPVAKQPAKPAPKKVAPVAKPAAKARPEAKAIPPKVVAKPALKPAKARKVEEDKEPEPIPCPFGAKELAQFKDLLLKLRDRIIDEMNFLARDNLNRSSKDAAGDLSSYSFHMADQGTDNFDREFAASLLSGEQDVLYEIEEALRRVDAGTYGVCEMSGLPIEKERLKVLPYARYSVAVQSQMEKGKPRFRPFRRVSIQQTATGEG